MLLNRSFPRSFAFREVPRCVVYHPILPSVRRFQSNSKIYRFLGHFLINLKIYFFFELHLEIFPGPQNHQKHAQSIDLSKQLRFKKRINQKLFLEFFLSSSKKITIFFFVNPSIYRQQSFKWVFDLSGCFRILSDFGGYLVKSH